MKNGILLLNILKRRSQLFPEYLSLSSMEMGNCTGPVGKYSINLLRPVFCGETAFYAQVYGQI